MTTPTQVTRTRMVDGRVVCNTAHTRRLHSLQIAVEVAPFVAGQFVRLELELDGEKLARPYSLVNPPDEPLLEVLFNTVPGGHLSNALAALREGDPVAVSQPATGFFVLAEVPAATDLWMMATGTGLGPYLSILRTRQLWDRFEKIVLVHGVPLREELVYQHLISQALHMHPERFSYVSCVSREENPEGFRGRITGALESGFLESRVGANLTASRSSVMLCGNHNMINDMHALLGQRGMRKHLRHKPGQIVTEQYF
ncbi:MAG: ferredoxin--NADP reductase [Halioglobus sp.]